MRDGLGRMGLARVAETLSSWRVSLLFKASLSVDVLMELDGEVRVWMSMMLTLGEDEWARERVASVEEGDKPVPCKREQ